MVHFAPLFSLTPQSKYRKDVRSNMTTKQDIKSLHSATAYDLNGEKLGKINELFVDDKTGQPTFAEVSHGLFGFSSSIVPLRGHRLQGEDLTLAFSKDRIKDAPEINSDEAITAEKQNKIFSHYGIKNEQDTASYDAVQNPETSGGSGIAGGTAATGGVAGKRSTSNPGQHRHDAGTGTKSGYGETEGGAAEHKHSTGSDADSSADEIVRSEEHLNVDKQRVATEEVRLRKYVTTDTETVEVPVSREEVAVERTPISADDAANYADDIGEQEASVTLYEDQVNVTKKAKPVEKVSLRKETVQDTETVSDDVRTEHIDTDTSRVDPDKK